MRVVGRRLARLLKCLGIGTRLEVGEAEGEAQAEGIGTLLIEALAQRERLARRSIDLVQQQ